MAHSSADKFNIEWYLRHVEAKIVTAFSSSVMRELISAAYGDSRIETVSAMLVDMSDCPSYELEPEDTHISFAFQRAAAGYTKITRSAMVTTNEQQIKDVQKYAELMAPQGRDVRIFDTVAEARQWLGVEDDVVNKSS